MAKKIKVDDIIEITGEGRGVLWRVAMVDDYEELVNAEHIMDNHQTGWVGWSKCKVLSPNAARKKIERLIAILSRRLDKLRRRL